MYKLFGLLFDADFALYAPRCEAAKPDVLIYQSDKMLPHAFQLDIKHIARFQIDNGNQILYAPYPGVTKDELNLFIMGSCMGALLQQPGYIVLHGNAVSFNHHTCQIYLGDQGAGKSTTAAWYYQKGASIVADDVCAIGFNQAGKPEVFPGIPQLKLWQASADLLGISTAKLRRVRKALDKFILPIASRDFLSKPALIDAIFEIDKTAHTKQRITGFQKFLKLKHHSYRYHFLANMHLEHAYLKQLMQLANQIQLFRMPRVVCKESSVV